MSELDIFSFDRRPKTLAVSPAIEQYFPYAAAWKEFDKLNKKIRGGGPLGYTIKAIDVWVFGAGAFSVHLMKGHKVLVLLGWVTLAVMAIFQTVNYRRRFLHWACPRCHSEWPGTKDEKDRACRVCGLQLHQLSP